MKYSRHIGVCALVAVSFLLLAFNVGCASIIAGSSQVVYITSNPDGAQIEIISKGGQVIHRTRTPTSIELKRGRGYFLGADLTARAQAEGYEEKEVRIPSRICAWYWGNIIFGGLIGMLIVDPLTGAMYTFPEEVHIDLEGTDSISSALGLPSTGNALIRQLDRSRSVAHVLVGTTRIVA